MNNTLIIYILNVAEKVVNKTTENNDSSNLWMLVAIGEFLIIIGLILANRFKRKPNTKQQFKEKSLAQEVDFNNIINSSINLINNMHKNYDAATANELERRILNSIKSGDPRKFKRGVQKVIESRKKNDS